MEHARIYYREEICPGDAELVKMLVSSSGYFNEEEIGIAVELAEERLLRGMKSGYHFIFAEKDGEVIGYTCFGPIGCTKASFDLYWIAVLDSIRGQNIGSKLLTMTEERIASLGGKRIYVETSSREQYKTTRTFYLKNGYREETVLSDFYDTNDSKVIYLKVLS